MDKISIGVCIFFLGILTIFGYHFKNSYDKEVSDANTILVGTSADYFPFSFLKNNSIVGFDIDIVQEVGRRLSKKVEVHDIPFDMLIPEIQLGRLHILAAGLTETPARAQRVLFTKPYIKGDKLLIIASSQKPIHEVSDMKGKEVIVNDGYTADIYVSGLSQVQIKRLKTPAEAFLALKSGKADAYVVASNTARPFLEKYGNRDFSIAVIPDTEDSYALAISRKYAELVLPVQQALDAMEQDGTIAALKQKWKLV